MPSWLSSTLTDSGACIEISTSMSSLQEFLKFIEVHPLAKVPRFFLPSNIGNLRHLDGVAYRARDIGRGVVYAVVLKVKLLCQEHAICNTFSIQWALVVLLKCGILSVKWQSMAILQDFHSLGI